MITSLEPNQVFVFGSNLGGRHMAGAAFQAKHQFGAEDGIGEGLTGQCYAFPTLDANLQKRTDEQLGWSVKEFYRVARENPSRQFLLTKVGCGIAGYDEGYMRSLFADHPTNVVPPDDWK
jgi:hypothetical protein